MFFRDYLSLTDQLLFANTNHLTFPDNYILVAEFTAAIGQNPDFMQAYIQRGLAYYDSGAILQSVYDYTEAIKLDESRGEAFYCRALARLTLKNLPGALDDVERAIRLNSDDAAAYDLRGIVRRKQGYIPDAIAKRSGGIANFKKAAELYLVQKNKEESTANKS